MNEDKGHVEIKKAIVRVSRYTIYITLILLACMGIMIISFLANDFASAPTGTNLVKTEPAVNPEPVKPKVKTPADAWKAPDESSIPKEKYGDMIRYGKDLLAHTSKYFGPDGTVAAISNGMNCQNCHLDGGTRIYGNNYASFISSFPKRLGRSGKVEPASARIAECFNRSLNGKVPDTSGKEIQAMLAYMKWVGQGVKKKEKLFGNATEKLAYLNRPASPDNGQIVYNGKCQSCHGANGEGVLAAYKKTYTYPPLWGKNSYSDGAGMYRITNFAGFVKNNMPFGSTYENPQLTDEEAWDVAAYVNSQPRPHKDPKKDYPNPKDKPMDAPYGPYADQFSETQHKYGPYQPIADLKKSDK